ncbi:glycosyltransferase family 4 protein [Spirosoma pollinicola]|uniref:Group 1 glycosyl transferase n=1 Tax=Spirosoma pollinicola TaxID=2057025 RepID=A0A2K8Z6Q2_9BACT|nr:glycosyltransferase family 4 protein [Spirosoma pollinicola]AUD05545.1 group 1 glycosyl transferase [Spirosoma pollinicola]
MKIALSADWFYPAPVGGAATTIYWLAKTLTTAGHDVTVVATSQDIPSSIPHNRWLVRDCGRVIYTGNPHFYVPLRHIWYGWRAIRQADVVHLNSLFYPASFAWLICCRLLRKPIVWSPHGELSPAALAFRPRLKQFLLTLFRWFNSDVLFHAASAEERNQIRQHFGPDARIGEIRTMMELPMPIVRVARPYLLYIGRMHPIKGIDRLLEALSASTLFRGSEYSLLIAGSDSDKMYAWTLRELVRMLGISAKVSFIGVVQGEQKEQLYADAHLLILPSHAENFGNVVIESLAQGTPVVASTNTPWQILEEEQAGRWVQNEPDLLRQAIESFLTMPPSHYELYRERALQLARRDYDITANPTRWVDFYETARNLSTT